MRIRLTALLATAAFLLGAPAAAQEGGTVLDQAAAALRRDPVFVHPGAERALSATEAGDVRDRIRSSGQPVFVAVLPQAATEEAGGDPAEVPAALARRTSLAGTYAVVSGSSFRAGSSRGGRLGPGEAGSLATRAFQAHRDEGTAAVLLAFVDAVAEAPTGAAGSGSREDDGGGGGPSLAPFLLVGGAGAVGVWAFRRGRRRRQETAEETREAAAERQMLQAELSVLADDVLALEKDVAVRPEAREDYEAAVTRYRAAAAAMEYADDQVDLVRVQRVVAEGQYAMARARARVEGREPPPPPSELRFPGRHDEPPVDTDDDDRPVYAGQGGPGGFYGGGGWFGGGGSFFGGLLLGQMLGGGWGWGGHGAWGDGGGGGGDPGDADRGGGDFGGGDSGGGDFDVGGGGGDW